jgi:hypothetical protein
MQNGGSREKGRRMMAATCALTCGTTHTAWFLHRRGINGAGFSFCFQGDEERREERECELEREQGCD